jgi:DNA replication protein DnaC
MLRTATRSPGTLVGENAKLATLLSQNRIKISSALNRPVDDWGKLLGDSAAVSAMLDRLLHHGHVLKCGPRSWRTHVSNPGDPQ